MVKKTTNQFINDAKKVHGEKYNYDMVNYDGSFIKVKIFCDKHGYFTQTPASHLQGRGCSFCNGSRIFKPDLSHIVYDDGSRAIPISEVDFVVVDGDDYEELMKYEWNGVNIGYASAWIKGSHVLMSRFIMKETNKKVFIDHKDGNIHNNRKSNLRRCSVTQNNHNRPGEKGSTSKYKGVSWHKRIGKWQVEITYKGKRKYVGYFVDEKEAAKAFDSEAKKLHGDFAYLNFNNSRT